MMEIIEIIGITLLIAGVLSFFLYFLTAQLKNGNLSVLHYLVLGVVFILLSFQSYSLMDAMYEKAAIEETMQGVNQFADDAFDYLDELDKQNGGEGKTGENIKKLAGNPLTQKAFNLFGLDICNNGKMTVEMSEKLKSEYNWYMFRRVCWMVGFMIIYLIVAYMIPGEASYSSRRSMRSDRYGTDRPRVSGNRRRYRR